MALARLSLCKFWYLGYYSKCVNLHLSSSNLIDHLREDHLLGLNSHAVAYHYCEFASSPTLEPIYVAGSLVRQLTEQVNKIPQAVRRAYHKLSGASPSLTVLLELFHDIAEDHLLTTYIVIDGVDECPDRSPMLGLIHTLRHMVWRKSTCKILVSSRPEYDLRNAWANEHCFAILPQHVKPSLQMYVHQELAKIPKLARLPVSARDELAADLVARADGMFRWARCQLEVLGKMRTARALRDALATLPEGLFETYNQVLRRIDEKDHEYVVRTLLWLIGSERPLDIDELAEAVAIDSNLGYMDPDNRLIDPHEILELCGSLVSIQQDRTVVLAHFSVQEYLLSHQLAKETGVLAKFALKETQASQHVSRCLLTYVFTVGLEIQKSQQTVFDESEFPLFQYAKSASIAKLQVFETVLPWVEARYESDNEDHHQLVFILDYVKPPALCEKNWANACFVQQIVQCALMCYWNGCVERESKSSRPDVGKSTGYKVAQAFKDQQRAWYVTSKLLPKTMPYRACNATIYGQGFWDS